MRNFGWAYLLLSLVGVVSTMMAFMPSIHHNLVFIMIGHSFVVGFTLISPLVSICSIIAFIFACLNCLQPRLIFITLALCYFWLWSLGIRLHVSYLNLYHSRLSTGFWSIATFWLPEVRLSHNDIPLRHGWLYLILWLALSIYGIYALCKSSGEVGENASGKQAGIRWPDIKILLVLPSLIVGFVGSFLAFMLLSDVFIHGLAIFLVFPISIVFYFLALILLNILGRKIGLIVLGTICVCLVLMVPITQHYVFEKLEWGFTSDRKGAKEGAVLVDACLRGDLKNVEALIAKGADINAKGRFGDIPLVAASQAGRREIVEILLARGAEVNAQSERGTTALMAASGMGKRDIVKILLTKGAEVNARDQSGGTALMSASGCGHHEILEILIAKGAEVNAKDNIRGDTALQAASRRSHREAVQVLLDHGANINIKNDMEGWTALLEASMYDNWQMAEMLIARGADVNAGDRTGRTALMSTSFKGNGKIVQAMIEHGAEVNAKANDGWNALSAAANKGNLEIVKMLLAQGADINAKDKHGNTALSLATERNHQEVRELLIKAGAK